MRTVSYFLQAKYIFYAFENRLIHGFYLNYGTVLTLNSIFNRKIQNAKSFVP